MYKSTVFSVSVMLLLTACAHDQPVLRPPQTELACPSLPDPGPKPRVALLPSYSERMQSWLLRSDSTPKSSESSMTSFGPSTSGLGVKLKP